MCPLPQVLKIEVDVDALSGLAELRRYKIAEMLVVDQPGGGNACVTLSFEGGQARENGMRS
jgi:hypothetical protein